MPLYIAHTNKIYIHCTYFINRHLSNQMTRKTGLQRREIQRQLLVRYTCMLMFCINTTCRHCTCTLIGLSLVTLLRERIIKLVITVVAVVARHITSKPIHTIYIQVYAYMYSVCFILQRRQRRKVENLYWL